MLPRKGIRRMIRRAENAPDLAATDPDDEHVQNRLRQLERFADREQVRREVNEEFRRQRFQITLQFISFVTALLGLLAGLCTVVALAMGKL